MDLDELCSMLACAGNVNVGQVLEPLGCVSFQDLAAYAVTDKYSAAVKETLELNCDCEFPLYIHQYQALYALAEGKDVLLITPCGSGQ